MLNDTFRYLVAPTYMLALARVGVSPNHLIAYKVISYVE